MKLHQIINESADPRVVFTAKRMIENYSELSYSPYDRAVDHAFSYDRSQPQHRYWMAVAEEILRQESQGS